MPPINVSYYTTLKKIPQAYFQALTSMIFKTFDSDIDNMSSRWGIFGKSFSDIGDTIKTKWKQVTDYVAVTNDATISGMMSAWKGTSPVQFLSDDRVVNVLNDYNKALDAGAEKTAKFLDAGTGNDFMDGWLKQLNGAPAIMDDYKAAVAKTESAHKGLTASMVASKVAALALNVAVSMGVSIAISALIKLVDNLVHANEKAIEKAEELRDKYNDFKETNASNVKTLNDLKEEFEELSEGVSRYGDNISLTTEQYKRYQEIIQQIVGMSPSLAEGYDTENGYITDKNKLLERAIELQEIEYKNELRKKTNLTGDLKTSMEGHVAEYRKSLDDGKSDRSFNDALWQVFNTNNRDNYDGQSMAKDIMKSLGVKDIDREIEKYINKYGYWQDNEFWNDYCDKIADNLEVVTNSLTAEEVGLDDTVFDKNIEKLESYAEQYSDVRDSTKSANESIQTDLGYIAEATDGYSDLSTEQQKFITDYLKRFDISDITYTNWLGKLKYDEDKMASVKSQIEKFINNLSQDDSIKQAVTDIYTPQGDDESVEDYSKRVNNAIANVQKYIKDNNLSISLDFGTEDNPKGIQKTIDDLQKSYNDAISSAQKKYSEDLTPFFEENSINTQEEIDKWLEIVQAADSAAEAEKKYVEDLTLNKTTFSDVWNSSTFADTKEKLLELAKSGELTPETLESTEDYKKLIDDTGLSAEYCAKRINNLVTAQEKLSNVTKGISSISDLYTQARDEGFVDINDIMSLDNTWKDLKSFEEFTNIVGSGTYSMSEMQQAFDKLVSEYLNYSDALIKLDETNKDLYIKQLKSVGVSNAQALVEERLTANYIEENNALEGLTEANKEEYIAKLKANNITNADVIVTNKLNTKKEAENTVTKELNMTMDEFLSKSFDMQNSLLGEANASDICRGEIAQLQLAEINYNKSGLDVSGKIKQLKDLVTAYGLADTEAQKMAKREQEMRDYEAKTGAYTGFRYTEADYKHAEEDTKKRIEALFGGLGQYTYTAPDYNGGEDRQKELSEKNTDWIETKVSRIQRLITNIGKTISVTYKTWKERIGAVKSETAKLTEELSIQQQAANYYLNKANSVGLSADYVNKIQNGAILIEDGIDEKTQEKIDKYTELYEKYLEALDSMEDIRGEIADNFKEKFDMVASSYDNAISLIESKSGILDSLVSKQETDGHLVSKAYYQSLKNLQNQNIAELQSKRTDLVKAFNEAMANGNIKQYSEDWYDMKNSIMEVEQALIDANTQLIELDNNMRDLDWKVFDLKQQYIGRIQEEADYLIDLMSNKDLYDDYGKMNDSGISTAGLHVTNYDVYLKQAQKYADEIKEIDKLLAKDSSDTELIERRNELIDSHRDMVKSAKDEQQAIIDMVEEGYNRLLDALNEIIDKRKEQLDAEKDLYDYERSIAEKTKNISSLQKQLSAYEGDNSEETQAKIQQIKVDLEEAKQDLQDAEYDKWMSDQEQMLDRLSSDTQEWIEARMNNIEAIMQDIINQTNENATLIKDTLVEQTDNLGSFISGEMSKIFSDGSPVSSFIESFTNEDSGVLKVINGIALNVQTMVDKLAGQAKSEIASNGATTTNSTKSSTTQKSTSKTTSSTPSTTKSTTKNTSSSNGNKDYKFIYAKSYYPKNKLNRKTSIDDALAFYDYDWSFNAKKKYYKDLIGNDAYTGSYNQNVALLKKFREIKGYNQGGVIGELKNIIGRNNDNSLAINTFEKGEGIIPLPLMGDWKTLINNLEPLNASMDFLNKALIPNIKANRSTNGTVNNDVQLSITLPNVTNYDEFKNALVKDKSFEKVVQSMTFGNALGKNSLNKNKY